MTRLRAFRTLENSIRRMGFNAVAGVDEVGRGCLAGPVVAAAVVLAPDRYVARISDSKTVTALERERLFDKITRAAVSWSVAAADRVSTPKTTSTLNRWPFSRSCGNQPCRPRAVMPRSAIRSGTA